MVAIFAIEGYGFISNHSELLFLKHVLTQFY